MRAIIVLGVAIILIFLVFSRWRKGEGATLRLEEIKVGHLIMSVEVARTAAEKAKGLSGRENLAEESGLLFVWDKAGQYQFWMKEMRFPIDIIWIGPDRKIVDFTDSARPESFPRIFTSREPAQYVLEARAGFFQKNNLKIGDPVELATAP